MTIHANQSQSEQAKFGGANMDPYENLANSIILRAVDDYRLTDNEKEMEEIEAFFNSDLFAVLTNLEPDLLINKLRKEKRNYDG